MWLIRKRIHGITWQTSIVLRNCSPGPNNISFWNRLLQLCQLSSSKTALLIRAMKFRFRKKEEGSWLVKLPVVSQKRTRLHKLANQQDMIEYVFLLLFSLYRIYRWSKIHVEQQFKIFKVTHSLCVFDIGIEPTSTPSNKIYIINKFQKTATCFGWSN
jgi:hypothetical protein